ncbi:DUF1127 domain-containing protein [Mesorhizobium sp. M00.F.Ca.ET.186.01.1.1]|nr:DUF1127 domain-containing protein [bacterium M00.F.Ca.ET.205.01.1.1]TGU55526.1 DUF1127 domain-containing protein [bacterium M00.F.Ca.ET.152.01.1.1]TGV40195.1 DUF1127 domain-containing protein [Mesorhizobium sp. M00.F.Ca.ET.186.01.1.1]TGZ45181.1 DUF1127 domain-containing protein [bacterium M00.F.Ca.ET.162.01.1.1]
MNDSCTLISTPHEATRLARQAPRRRLAALLGIIATWREQRYFRWDLKRISETNPHLIDDIGLTRQQVEDEIAKLPFWQR